MLNGRFVTSRRLVAGLVFLAVLVTSPVTAAFGSSSGSDRVLLRDVSALTLYPDRMTAGRRSHPVPQLQCVGGTAKGHYKPSVVQCINRGSDGYDIQWECKADMDNSFKFGQVEVTCEGYDYPDDPYVLKGSCGLEYTVDFTEEGYQKNRQQGHTYSHSHNDGGYWNPGYGKKASSIVGDLLFLCGIALVIYIIYKTCLASNATGGRQDDPGYPRADMGGNQPPPYGFRPEYMPHQDSCSSSRSSSYSGGAGPNTGGGGGFWTGAATGGLLGYLFGRNNSYGTYTQRQPYNTWGTGYRSQPYFGGGCGSGWGSGGGTTFTRGSSSSSSSMTFGGSGSRTASGFGGTKRR